MPNYSAVSFVGAESVIEAYRRRKAARWSVWCGKDFMFFYDGNDIDAGQAELEGVLDMLMYAKGCYILKVYDSVDSKGLNDKTPAHGSFTFRLQEREEGVMAVARGGGADREVLYILKEMQKSHADLVQKVAVLESGEVEETETDAGIGKIIGVIGKLAEIPLVQTIIQKMFAPQVSAYPPGYGALGVQPQTVQHQPKVETMQPATNADNQQQQKSTIDNNISETEAESLGRSFVIIRNSMPDCLTFLQKLADIAMNDPQRFANINATIKMFLS